MTYKVKTHILRINFLRAYFLFFKVDKTNAWAMESNANTNNYVKIISVPVHSIYVTDRHSFLLSVHTRPSYMMSYIVSLK